MNFGLSFSTANAAAILRSTINAGRRRAGWQRPCRLPNSRDPNGLSVSAIIVYRLLELLASPLVVVYLVWRGLRDRRYFRTLAERLGFLPRPYRQTGQAAIWLHAVSVGEVLAAVVLAR